MAAVELGFWTRLWLALVLLRKILADRALAARVQPLVESGADALPEGPRGATPARESPPPSGATALKEIIAEPVPAAPPAERTPDATPALQLLAILQREGRLIDFLQEDVASFSDADIGAAARVVHEGCRRAMREYLEVAPVRTEREGDAVVLERGFDPSRTRITGATGGEPPFRGKLAHHGWVVTQVRLPVLSASHDARVVAPAEVEITGAAR